MVSVQPQRGWLFVFRHTMAGVMLLRVLLDSIVSQSVVLPGAVEICISDNASADGTAALVAEYSRRRAPGPSGIHRFERDMRGARNFSRCRRDMASAEYCWFIGSDDALLPGAIRPSCSSCSSGPAHRWIYLQQGQLRQDAYCISQRREDIALPSDPERSRPIPAAEVMEELALRSGTCHRMSFGRDAWQTVSPTAGSPFWKPLRHFSHVFMFATIARRWGWYLAVALTWLSSASITLHPWTSWGGTSPDIPMN